MTGPKAQILARARELGFDAVGIARADEPLGVEYERYLAFVEGGKHGAMSYLANDLAARRQLDGDAVLPGAKSVICVARRYKRTEESERGDPEVAQHIARYARGQDYHVFLRKKLRQLAKLVRTLAPGTEARPILDEEPVLERAWAARAGLGFVGKNGLVIIPGQGSFVLLGEVVTTLELPPDTPMTERCGSCTRCLDACPTQAFEQPFVLDPRKCISYLTIEDAAGDRDGAGEHLFGCDDCQSVCPFNRTAPPDEAKTQQFRPLPIWQDIGLEDLVRLDEAAFFKLTIGTPLRRATHAGLARSAATVAAAAIDAGRSTPDAERALEAAKGHDDPLVRAIASRTRPS
ncbi:MAG: tRNA epoxyqueuosine(34) reductase QueG [Polyangiaceae bacterium]|nr:tRNA epoxyqueuosine(34) reductase QueG [Polyangiaceae bacterium]